MPINETLPRRLAVEFLAAVDALRGETAALHAADLLGVTVDDLLDAAEGTQAWLADLAAAVEHTAGDPVLPQREPWSQVHVVYAVSAVLVWAERLREEGRLATRLSIDALAAWERVEHLAGVGGRTAGAFGVDPAMVRLMTAESAGTITRLRVLPEPTQRETALLSVA